MLGDLAQVTSPRCEVKVKEVRIGRHRFLDALTFRRPCSLASAPQGMLAGLHPTEAATLGIPSELQQERPSWASY